jgi:hypothetical protein
VPKLVIEEPHSRTRAEAMGRLDAAVGRAAGKHGSAVQRPSEYERTLSLYGADGRLSCLDDRVRVELDLPLAAWVFKSKVESEVRRELRAVLDA